MKQFYPTGLTQFVDRQSSESAEAGGITRISESQNQQEPPTLEEDIAKLCDWQAPDGLGKVIVRFSDLDGTFFVDGHTQLADAVSYHDDFNKDSGGNSR